MTLLAPREDARTGRSKHWRGPLPNRSNRMLQPKGGFYKKIPMSLLRGAAPDLGVMVWALLRISFDGQAKVASYRLFARCLNLDHLTDTAVEKRFGAALKPLLGTWIIRKRLPDNSYLYEARLPPEAASDRYAILRPSDIDLLDVPPPRGIDRIDASDLAAFCRWQLECGRRGWTVDTLRNIAERWGVTHPTMAKSRDRLATLGLLKVVPRPGGRFSDLIWLEEVYDPHWQVDEVIQLHSTHETMAVDDADYPGEVWKVDGRLLGKQRAGCSVSQPPVGWKEDGRSGGKPVAVPIQGIPTEYLTEDPTDLGVTSVTPLKSATCELSDAPPAASSSEKRVVYEGTADHRHIAARLVRQHRVLAAAKPHFRTAMIKRLTSAFELGLAPGHVDRALALVAEDAILDAECLIVKQALQQAWVAQRVGMCADCGDRDRHSPGCPQFDFSWADEATAPAINGHRPAVRNPGTVAADPLAMLLHRPVTDSPDDLDDDAEVVEWMTVRLAQQIAAATDREATLRAVWARWRSALPPGRRDLLDHANEHVRYALNLRRVS